MTDTEESLGIIFGADDIRQSSLEHLARYSVLLRMKKGQHLYREREEIVTVYAVVSGTAALYKMNAMGEKKVIFVLGRGSLLNEEILQDLPEPVSCEIMEEALILAVHRKQLLALMETDARLMRFLFSSQSHKVRRLYRQLKNTTNATRGEKKMAAKLWKLARDYGKREKDGVRICLKLTVTQLADMLGTKRETASRQLKVLVEQDLVRYDKNTFVIPEPDALNSYFKE